MTVSETVILGNFNTDVSSKCALVRNLNSLCDMFSLRQIIKDFTRVTSTTSTIIDLILVSDPEKISQSGIIDYCVSDHLMTFCTRKVTRGYIGKHNTVTVRSLKHYTKEIFQQSLLGSDWSLVLCSDDVNTAWNNFN